MKNRVRIPAACTLVLGTIIAANAQSQYHKEILYTGEEAVAVRLESAYGRVHLGRGQTDKIVVADMLVEPSQDFITDIHYRIDDGLGKLKLELKPPERQKRTISLGNLDSGTWELQFIDHIPLQFDIELGAGKGNFDFTGLRVNKLNLSTGASTVSLRFAEPNKGSIEHMKIESGVSRFTADFLSNANFKQLSFQGGVGSYVLDFGGELSHEGFVNVDVGLGSVTLIVPPHIGVKLIAQQRLFSSVDVPNDFGKNQRNEYTSPNYETAKGKLTIKVEAGMGSVKLKR